MEIKTVHLMLPETTTIHTENYRLRIPDESDIDFVFSATRYAGFNDGMQWEAPESREELFSPLEKSREAWAKGEAYSFTIESAGPTWTRLGRISIRKTEEKEVWNIGFWTHPEFQGKGIMTEAVGAILGFGFTKLKAVKISSSYATWNKASEKVLIHNGFKFVKHIEKGLKKQNGWVSENELALTASQWEHSKPGITSCDFCDAIKENNNIVFESDEVVALLDIDPISIGHIIICPKAHFTDFHELPDHLIGKIMSLAKEYIRVLSQLFNLRGYSMMANGGEFNDLKHVHIHVFPRNSKEEFQWVFSDKVPEDAIRFDVIKNFLKGHMPKK
ncbi:MAG: GNAT family N-acetyltransferase [Lewinellaceae bacterium]|nr:GNAT family N-acetyltransferase [Phaeodactylibacter sp.]MCB9350438.1 GNAT family N-acetyltransferase [Lewinellaceae bacterium]